MLFKCKKYVYVPKKGAFKPILKKKKKNEKKKDKTTVYCLKTSLPDQTQFEVQSSFKSSLKRVSSVVSEMFSFLSVIPHLFSEWYAL